MSTLIPELERELESAIARRLAPAAPAPAPRRRRARRISRRGALVLVAALLLLAAAALAATRVFPTGTAVKEDNGIPDARATARNGRVRPGSVEVLPLRVPDPDGGPSWGLRISATTRGTGCLQVGRVVGGRLGALGIDGAFLSDGRFHPFAASYGVNYGCVQLDAAGRLFLSQNQAGFPAAGTLQNGACVFPGEITGDPSYHDCAPDQMRDLLYGTLGPHARSITYKKPDGSLATVPVVRPWGAFLVVAPSAGKGSSGYMMSFSGADPTPPPPVTQVTFDDNSVCGIDPKWGWAGPGHDCPQVGFAPRQVPRGLTKQTARAHIHARVVKDPKNDYRDIVVWFRAPVAITNADAVYNITRKRQGARGWGSGRVDRNIRRGQLVASTFRTVQRGVYHGVVQYQWLGGGPKGRRVYTVGNYVLRVP
jgi:hypothetical protein